MLSYNRIRQISEMFDSNIQISVNLHDHLVDLDDDMDWNYNTLNFPPSEFYSVVENFPDFTSFDQEPLSPQIQIRNHDCMWSGRCTTHPNECLNNRNNCNVKFTTNDKIQQQSNGSNGTNVQSQQTTTTLSLLNSQQIKMIQQKKQQQNIPAGQSLLRLKHIKPTVIKIPTMSTNDFLKDRDYIARPDTPLSLDDDPPEFKHTIDIVAACTMGSNEMSLINKMGHESSPTEIINILKEHLEDNSNRTPPKIANYMSSIKSDGLALDELINDIKSLSDFENDSDDDETDASDTTNDSFNISNTMVTLPIQSQASHQISSASAKNSASVYDITQSMHSDHSYTRSKARVDVIGLGVQTPSDSGKLLFIYFFH